MNKNGKKHSSNLSDYIEQKLELGSITFTKIEAITDIGCTELSFMRSTQRLQKKGVLIRPVSGFYVIVEPEYRAAGGPPPIQYIGKLMKFLKLPYYVGLLTAAKYHGATHQSVFETQVFTTRPVSSIKYGKHRIRFITNKFTEQIPKTLLKTPHGEVQISSPEATIVDLIRYNKKAAGLLHVATVFLEMKNKLNINRLPRLANIHNDTPLVQRVGYILEEIADKPAVPLHKWLKQRDAQIIKLEPSLKPGQKFNKKWSVNVNTNIEADEV